VIEKKCCSRMSIRYSALLTLLEVTKMKPSEVLDSIKVLKVRGKRAIEFPGSEELRYQNPLSATSMRTLFLTSLGGLWVLC